MNLNNFLFDEEPLIVQPTLAKALGINEAIIIQQIHYWLKKKLHFYDNKYWTYNTYEDWAKQFSWLHPKTVNRIILNLEKIGVLESNNYNKAGFDKTKWYTINYAILTNFECHDGQICPSIVTNESDDSNESLQPIPETTTKTTTSNNIHKPKKTLEQQMKELELELDLYKDKYPAEMLKEFYEYWTEPNTSKTKILKNLKDTWDIGRRLSTWERNQEKFGNKTTAGKDKFYTYNEMLQEVSKEHITTDHFIFVDKNKYKRK